MERGKLSVLRQGPNGPYYNHQTWEQGQNVSRYVPADQVPALQAAIEGYGNYQQLVEQYADLIIQRTRQERGGQVKKKARTSSWPKRRKSSS